MPEGSPAAAHRVTLPAGAVDHTPKLYIGGLQVRPAGGASREVWQGGQLLGVVPVGNRIGFTADS